MELFDYLKSFVLNFKLNTCCWIASVRVGLIIVGYFNAFVGALCILGITNETFTPTMIAVETKIMEEDTMVSQSVPMLAYIIEVGFSALCLCGIYRKDLVLLRIYMYYCVAALVMSVLVYSIVILAIDLIIQIAIIYGILFQLFVLLLVRSAIVEIKWEKKQSELPTFIMSSIIHDKEKERELAEKERDRDQASIKSDSKHSQEKEVVKTDAVESTVETGAKSGDVEKAEEAVNNASGSKKEVEIKLETVKEEVGP